MQCNCVERPWFVGIPDPMLPENVVIYFEGCEVHTPEPTPLDG